MPEVLTTDLIGRFEQILRAVGSLGLDKLNPGIGDAEIDRLCEPHGVVLPEEARCWWRWQNGSSDGKVEYEVVAARGFYRLSTALELFEISRPFQKELGRNEMLLRPVSECPWLFFDCSGPHDAPVPVYTGDVGVEERFALPSIGELVITWIDLIEQGVLKVGADGEWLNPTWDMPQGIVDLGVY